MYVHCRDGTTFECERYDVTEFGLVCYGQEASDDRDRYEDAEPRQIGFVPHARLRYILPRGVTPQTDAAPQASRSPPPRTPRTPGP